MDKQEFLEAEVRWLLALKDDEPITACLPKVIVRDLLERLRVDIEAGRLPAPLVTRSRAPRHVPVSIIESEDEA